MNQIKALLLGLDSEKWLNDLMKMIIDHKNRLAYLESDIEKLIELAKKLDGYTSDDEEAFFVENLVSELETVKWKIDVLKELTNNIEKDILDLKKWIESKQVSNEDLIKLIG